MQHFDYVLVLNADAAPVTAPAGTCLVSDQGYAKLYRVAAHCGGGRGASRPAHTRGPGNGTTPTEIPLAITTLDPQTAPIVIGLQRASSGPQEAEIIGVRILARSGA